jgi:ribosomal protein S18 acetylase RimI-like enzyme
MIEKEIAIRMAQENDLQEILQLYTQFRGEGIPDQTPALTAIWDTIMNGKYYNIFVAEQAGAIVASITLLIIPNLTHNQRPYAIIENVITDEAHRGKGIASALMDVSKEMARAMHCYKIMLLTSSKKDSTLGFYERAGFNRNDKTAFVMWLD